MKKSNQNPTGVHDSFAFGAFELSPSQRRLTRSGRLVRVKPKTLDLLLLLVSRAGQLVSKDEIRQSLWPDVQVEDANLTNAIAAIRRVLGRKAIRTSPKHGYQFDLPLTRRPGAPPEVVMLFEEAKALFPLRMVEAMMKAQRLYWICLAQAPEFAEAWAWLGRCSRWLARRGHVADEETRLAEAAFLRALQLEPDLASAHEFYTLLQVDQGQGIAAMVRLLEQGRRHQDEPRIFSALTHVLRYCGLLSESLAAHEHVIRLRAEHQTSVAHTLFNRCDFAEVIESYGGPVQTNQRGYLDLAAWAALGQEERAAGLARRRLAAGTLPPALRLVVSGFLSALEGRREAVAEGLTIQAAHDDPEEAIYHARHLSRCGDVEHAIEILCCVVIDMSYGCAHLLTHDPWFANLRRHRQFRMLRAAAAENETRARAEFRRAQGNLVLG